MKSRRYILFAILLLAAMVQAQVKSRGAFPTVQNPPPEPNFSWTGTCLSDTTCFISQTIRGYSYTWTVWADTVVPPFGIVQSQLIYSNKHDTSFCFKFPHPGTYTVGLNAYDNHYASISKIITIDSVTKAVCDYQACSNYFINNSLCASSFLWDFGDGTQSTEAIPSHIYADTGTYNVSLIAYKGNISDTARITIHVTVETWPDARWSYTMTDSVVHFHALSISKVTNFNWSFGDLRYGTSRDTMDVYKDSTAFYVVDMSAVNGCGYAAMVDTIYITKYSPHVESEENVVIAPNPVANNEYAQVYYNAYVDASYLANVYNAQGQTIFRASFPFRTGLNEFKIDTALYPDGVYILVMESGNSYIRKKFQVSRKP